MESLGSRNLMAKTTIYGRLSLSEIFVPTIERKIKEADEYGRSRMGYSRQKGTRNNIVVVGSVGDIQHFKGN